MTLILAFDYWLIRYDMCERLWYLLPMRRLGMWPWYWPLEDGSGGVQRLPRYEDYGGDSGVHVYSSVKTGFLQVTRAAEAVDSSDSDQTDSEIGDTKVR